MSRMFPLLAAVALRLGGGATSFAAPQQIELIRPDGSTRHALFAPGPTDDGADRNALIDDPADHGRRRPLPPACRRDGTPPP